MHQFGNPRHTWSMVAYWFWRSITGNSSEKVALRKCCQHALLIYVLTCSNKGIWFRVSVNLSILCHSYLLHIWFSASRRSGGRMWWLLCTSSRSYLWEAETLRGRSWSDIHGCWKLRPWALYFSDGRGSGNRCGCRRHCRVCIKVAQLQYTCTLCRLTYFVEIGHPTMNRFGITKPARPKYKV